MCVDVGIQKFMDNAYVGIKTDISNIEGDLCLQYKDHQISQLSTEIKCRYNPIDVFISIFKVVLPRTLHH